MKRSYETLTIYMAHTRTQAQARDHLSRMLDDYFPWLDCDGVIVIRW